MLDQILTVTYVTDPDLDATAQRRVIREFMSCANEMLLRVAFRLPDVSDTEVGSLIQWYLDFENAERLLPPLIHERAELARTLPDCHLWLPSRGLWTEHVRARAYSVHSAEEAQQAVERGAAELIYGHVFATQSHPGEPARGGETLANLAANAALITAIGGINEQTVGQLRAIGINRIAMIRAVSRSPDIAMTLRSLHKKWEGSTHG